MEIKKLQKDELKNALDLVWSVFEEFEAPDYAERGVQEFREFIALESIIDRFNRGAITFWGCYDENTLTGVIAVRDKSHICLLFVRREYHRRGIAGQLFRTAADECRQDESIGKITVNSSPYAAEAYRHLGFIDTDKEKTVNGIRFVPMEYRLI